MAREQGQYADREASLLSRRGYLKLASAAIAGVAGSGSAAAQPTSGYGAGGFGESPYGGAIDTSGEPVIDSFSVSTSEQLGDDRMIAVNWSVSDPKGELDTVEVVVNNDVEDIDFSVSDVQGKGASDWDLFQFPVGTTLSVTIRVQDTAGSATKDTKSVTL